MSPSSPIQRTRASYRRYKGEFMNRITLLILSFLCLASPLSMQAYDDSPRCYKNLQKDFFSYDLVIQALSMYQIPQGQWELIFQNLQSALRDAPEIIRTRASQQDPNPLEYPFQPKEAEDILFEAMFEIFSNVMKVNGAADPRSSLNDPKNVREMFGYIRQQQAFRLHRCMGTEGLLN
jgi:hypothetical protein